MQSNLSYKRRTRTGSDADMQWTVILVEDNPDDDMLARRILEPSERIGEVVSCRDAAQLFKVLEHNHLNKGAEHNTPNTVILLDIHLPGIDGMVLLEQLKTSPLTDNLPIIILTGDDDLDMVYKSYRNHANAFISKPLNEAHLKDIYAVFDKGTCWKDAPDTLH